MTIIASLARRYEALAEAGELPPPGGATVRIGFEVVIGPDGALKRMALLGDPAAKGPKGRLVDGPVIARTSGVAPGFLWDKTAYLLGVTALEEKTPEGKRITAGQKKRTEEEHAAFIAEQQARIGDSDDAGLRAILAFYRDHWRPERFAAEEFETELLDLNGAFRLEGDARRFIHERPAAMALWAVEEDGPEGVCLATGETRPLARLHPVIKGVYGAQSSGAYLSSVNATAFESQGWSQGETAPVSTRVAHGYGAALNALLAKGSGRALAIGDTTVAIWAETREGMAGEHLLAQAVQGGLFDDPFAKDAPAPEPFDADSVDGRNLSALLQRLGHGQTIEADLKRLNPATRIQALGLAPNNARLAVRFWHAGSLGKFAANLTAHWTDMALTPDPFDGAAPKTWALAYETAVHVQNDRGHWTTPAGAQPPQSLPGELLSAILTDTPYPATLLSALLMRIRAERGRVTGARAALLKAYFNRNIARRRAGEVLDVTLDIDRQDAAYRLGRLFALYEWAEYAANGERNATLRDKYFATACAMPQRLFAPLGTSFTHDLAKLRKTKSGLAVVIDKQVGQAMDGLDDLPRSLPSEQQAQFILGYYHQKQDRFAKHGEDEPAADEGDDA